MKVIAKIIVCLLAEVLLFGAMVSTFKAGYWLLGLLLTSIMVSTASSLCYMFHQYYKNNKE